MVLKSISLKNRAFLKVEGLKDQEDNLERSRFTIANIAKSDLNQRKYSV